LMDTYGHDPAFLRKIARLKDGDDDFIECDSDCIAAKGSSKVGSSVKAVKAINGKVVEWGMHTGKVIALTEFQR
jgi:hypothetical protein